MSWASRTVGLGGGLGRIEELRKTRWNAETKKIPSLVWCLRGFLRPLATMTVEWEADE